MNNVAGVGSTGYSAKVFLVIANTRALGVSIGLRELCKRAARRRARLEVSCPERGVGIACTHRGIATVYNDFLSIPIHLIETMLLEELLLKPSLPENGFVVRDDCFVKRKQFFDKTSSLWRDFVVPSLAIRTQARRVQSKVWFFAPAVTRAPTGSDTAITEVSAVGDESPTPCFCALTWFGFFHPTSPFYL